MSLRRTSTPIGRTELLELIKDLSRERTVFVNSHILPEVEKIADYVAVINKGQLVAQGTINQLQEMVRGANYVYIVKSRRAKELKEFLEASSAVSKINLEEGGLRLVTSNPEAVWEELAKAYNEAGITVTEFKEVEKTLEDVFFKLIMREEEKAS